MAFFRLQRSFRFVPLSLANCYLITIVTGLLVTPSREIVSVCAPDDISAGNWMLGDPSACLRLNGAGWKVRASRAAAGPLPSALKVKMEGAKGTICTGPTATRPELMKTETVASPGEAPAGIW